ncbi:E3 ubiquitin-protein ligase RNF8 isoform X2 [Bombina bombina]|uniref:E3 ubiquitin-protein ligase RNF8 isoform X2 n=1 Tax=Bombina bombina TaxID=8345 RepID=UPI00235A62F6|nr:E3 ubiquitin-protein ligase RNF8 isoform X2 [Bombina bombina]
MISRTHCIFQQNEEGKWTVMDNKSLNGVWLNKERLESCRAYIVSVGSCIQLGVPLPDKERPEFEYRLVQERMSQAFPLPSAPKTLKTNGSRAKRKLNTEDFEVSTNSSKTKIHRTSIECENPAKSLHRTELAKQPTLRVEDVASEDLPESCDSIDGDTLAPTQQQCRSTLQLSKVRQTMVEIRRLNVQMQEKQMEMQERLNAPHQSQTGDLKDVLAMEKELHELQNQLSNERKEHLQRVQDLKQIYQEEQQKQGERKLAEEEHLREQLAQALQEHTLLMEELNRNKNNFAQIIEAKDKELQETKKEKEEVRAQKEEVLSHMNEVLDNELQCIICSEHFIEAVTLNCAHSFCSYCIKSWRRRKDECPICRQPIHSETRSLVLDNCIDSMVAKLSVEMKERRAKLIKERKGESTEQSSKGGRTHTSRQRQ